MVVETRQRQTTSWTPFAPSPFFGNGVRSAHGGNHALDWSPKTFDSKAHVHSNVAKNKRSVKSIGTTGTLSTSASASTARDDKDGSRVVPSLAEELQLNISHQEQNTLSPAPTQFVFNDTRERCQALGTNAAQAKEQVKTSDPYDKEGEEDESTLSSYEYEVFGRRKRRVSQRSAHVQHHDACMPFALEDVRELATKSMNKAMAVWSQVQTLFYQKLDAQDEDQIRKRLSRTATAHPTTVFIIPKGSNSMEKTKDGSHSALGSLADSLTVPTALQDDAGDSVDLRTHDDDMSSLTEPAVFHSSKPLPPLLRMRKAEAVFRRDNEVTHEPERPIQVNLDENGDEYIEFEPEDVEVDNYGGRLNDGIPIALTTSKKIHSNDSEKESSHMSEPSLSDRFRTMLPQLLPPSNKKSAGPKQPSKVQLVWSAECPKPGASRAQLAQNITASDLASVSC